MNFVMIYRINRWKLDGNKIQNDITIYINIYPIDRLAKIFCNFLLSFLLASWTVAFIDLVFAFFPPSSMWRINLVPNVPFDLIASESFSAIFKICFSAFLLLLPRLLPLTFLGLSSFLGSAGRISMSRSWNSIINRN